MKKEVKFPEIDVYKIQVMPKVNTIGKIIEEPLIPNNNKIFEKAKILIYAHTLSTPEIAGVKILIINCGSDCPLTPIKIKFKP